MQFGACSIFLEPARSYMLGGTSLATIKCKLRFDVYCMLQLYEGAGVECLLHMDVFWMLSTCRESHSAGANSSEERKLRPNKPPTSEQKQSEKKTGMPNKRRKSYAPQGPRACSQQQQDDDSAHNRLTSQAPRSSVSIPEPFQARIGGRSAA